jgi:hypothetical protein
VSFVSVVAVPLGLAVGIAPLIACWGGHHAGYAVKPCVLYPSHGSVTVVVCRVLFVVCWLHSAVEQPPCHHQREREQEPGLDHAQRGWLSQRGW